MIQEITAHGVDVDILYNTLIALITKKHTDDHMSPIPPPPRTSFL